MSELALVPQTPSFNFSPTPGLASQPAVQAGVGVCLNMKIVADAMMISENQACKALSDGRVISRFTEFWAESIFGVTKCENTNQVGIDAFEPTADGGAIYYAIRSLTRGGIRFQGSRYMGAGRSCSIQQLIDSVRCCDYWIIFDITKLPTISSYKIASESIAGWIADGELGISGISPERFYRLIKGESPPTFL